MLEEMAGNSTMIVVEPYLAEGTPFGVDHHLFVGYVARTSPFGHVFQIFEVTRIRS